MSALHALKGKLLVATPLLADPNFARTVVLLCDHDAEGAFSGQDYFPEKLGRQEFYQPVERGFEPAPFCSMAIAGQMPSMASTSGFSIWPRNWRA